jgi:hypothetical protein
MGRASGTSEVQVTPQSPEEGIGDPTLGSACADKQFSGGLEATSKGQMLATQGTIAGSAGYVAMGALRNARRHEGNVRAATQRHDDAWRTTALGHGGARFGNGRASGLAGRMMIDIVDKKHLYNFEYTLAVESDAKSGGSAHEQSG